MGNWQVAWLSPRCATNAADLNWNKETSVECSSDPIKRVRHIRLNVTRKYSQHGVIMIVEPRIFFGAGFCSRRAFVRWNKVDHNTKRERHKITDVLTDRGLALEATAGKAAVVGERLP